MMQQPRSRGRLRLRSMAAWSFGIGLAWLLLGQQLAGQPMVQLDLTAGLPGAASVHPQPPAPTRPAPDPRQPAPAPHRQTSPQSSPERSTGSSPLRQHSTGTSTGTSPQNSQAGTRAVAFALAQQGKPYQWGAEGPDTYDCSGLTWLAWQHAGLSWERMPAAGQWQWLHQHGQDMPPEQLRAGDLLFYANNLSDPATIHHVAMAIGNGRMVEAPEPGIPVRVVPVRQEGFYAAARPIP